MSSHSLNHNIFSQNFTIRSYETDQFHRLHPPFLMWMMQETAVNHVEALGLGYDELIKHQLAWALSGFHFQIEKMPKWNDEVEVRTWHREYRKLCSIRDFTITYKDSGEVAARASSSWFILNLEKRRPVRIQEVTAGLEGCSDIALDSDLKRFSMDGWEPSLLSPDKQIRTSFVHQDHNDHVNNVHYLRWMLSALDDEHLKTHVLKELEIYFLREICAGEQPQVFNQMHPGQIPAFKHRLLNEGMQNSAVALSRWQERGV